GECGATVYVTGRSVRGEPTTDNAPGTIEDTAEQVTARGGRGITVRCDHTDSEQVKSLFELVRHNHGRVDLLVNNAWGGYEGGPLEPKLFWQVDFAKHWRGMFIAGLGAHMLASYYAIPLMLPAPAKSGPQKQGLVVSTVAWDHDQYIGNVYDISKHAIVRMIWGLSLELRSRGIAAIAVAPGFTRSERVLAAFGATEQNWRQFPGLKQTETPEYVGRAIASLAGDPKVMSKSGKTFRAGELARLYRFTDVDGRRVPPFTVPQKFMKAFLEGPEAVQKLKKKSRQ
ncbi:MAG: SDR family NAD(P)-dependent oxidoreductase, partial [Terriglobales bacterium]